MKPSDGKITVFYDGSCPQCVQDRCNYERHDKGDDKEIEVEWFDITGREGDLIAMGIDPDKALRELHIRDQNGEILSELDAYQVLMARVPHYRWLGWFINLPLIRPISRYLYHWMVIRRLKKEGRI